MSSTNYVHPITLLPVFVMPLALDDKNKLLSKTYGQPSSHFGSVFPGKEPYKTKQIILQQIRIEFQFARKTALCSMSICSKTQFSLGDRHATCLQVWAIEPSNTRHPFLYPFYLSGFFFLLVQGDGVNWDIFYCLYRLTWFISHVDCNLQNDFIIDNFCFVSF